MKTKKEELIERIKAFNTGRINYLNSVGKKMPKFYIVFEDEFNELIK
jgi:hypothetical protein